MTALTSLAARFAARQHVLSAWIGSPDPANAAMLAREDFDAVTFDMQHGAVDLAGVIRGIPLVMAAGKPALASGFVLKSRKDLPKISNQLQQEPTKSNRANRA